MSETNDIPHPKSFNQIMGEISRDQVKKAWEHATRDTPMCPVVLLEFMATLEVVRYCDAKGIQFPPNWHLFCEFWKENWHSTEDQLFALEHRHAMLSAPCWDDHDCPERQAAIQKLKTAIETLKA